MEMELVVIKNGEPITSTLLIARNMKLSHRSVMKLIDKYLKYLEVEENVRFQIAHVKNYKDGTFTVASEKIGGKNTRFAWLNEQQAIFFGSLLRNSEVVLKFKTQLSREFVNQRKLIAYLLTQRQNKAWLEQRAQGKISRRQETDTIQIFVDYARSQGSGSPDRYYSNISRMENKALFLLEQEFPNVREVLSGQQLQIIANADLVVEKALKYGMEKQMDYKDIYIMAKERIEQFADLVGKTPVPMFQDQLRLI